MNFDNVRIGDIIRFSVTKTKGMFFPIRYRRWFRIMIIVWLGGQAVTLGGDFGLSSAKDGVTVSERMANMFERVKKSRAESSKAEAGGSQALDDESKQQHHIAPSTLRLVWAIVGITMLVGLFWLWNISCFKFVFMELMVDHDTPVISTYWRHRELGTSYCFWVIGFTAIVLGGPVVIGMALLGSAGFVPFIRPEIFKTLLSPFVGLSTLAYVGIVLGVVFLMAFHFFVLLLKDFIVPIMYRDKLKAMRAWNVFLKARPSMKQLVIYFALKFGLLFLVLIASSIIVACASVLAAGGILLMNAVGKLLVGLFPLAKTALAYLGLTIFIGGGAFFFISIILLTLPFPVFFRAFALTYMVKLLPDYNLLRFPAPAPAT